MIGLNHEAHEEHEGEYKGLSSHVVNVVLNIHTSSKLDKKG